MIKNLSAWLWGAAAFISVIIVGYLDWLTGYELNFFVFYFLPISIGAWFTGLGGAISISLFSAIVWFWVDVLTQAPHSSQFYVVWNTIIRLIAFQTIGYTVWKIRFLLDVERRLSEDLRRTISEIKILEAILPICCVCKKIRDEKGSWQQIESYFSEHTSSKFSHGYCPECGHKALEEFKQLQK